MNTPEPTPLPQELLHAISDYALACHQSLESIKAAQRRVSLIASIRTYGEACRGATLTAEKRCEYCDGTGDVHDQTGEWRGVCKCPAGASLSAPTPEQPTDSLCQRLQQKCSDWGTYWRASDAHGVKLSHEQALELLRDALGVEVEVAAPHPVGEQTLTDALIANIIDGAWKTAETETANGEAPETEWARYGEHVARAILAARGEKA